MRELYLHVHTPPRYAAGFLERIVHLLFGCRHRRVSWPQAGSQTCLDCGHERSYWGDDHRWIAGSWHTPLERLERRDLFVGWSLIVLALAAFWYGVADLIAKAVR